MTGQINDSPQPASATPSRPKSQQKRGNKQRSNNNTLAMTQTDGTVSDSVINPTPTTRVQKTPKHRQQSAAAAPGGYYGNHNGNHKSKSPSYGGQPATPAKEQAYAGPTFASSPAPSSLPVPKFFSKSAPNVAAQSSLQARVDGEQTTDVEGSSPEFDNALPTPQPSRDSVKSPLDVFFNADRVEKQKRQSASGTRSALMQELDGDNVPSPRINHGNGSPQHAGDDYQLEASTKALKNLLFNKTASPSTNNAQPFAQPTDTPPPFQRTASGPSTPAPLSEQQANYYYGNRHLSPMFQAVRNETPIKSPGFNHSQSDINSYPQHPHQQMPPFQYRQNSFHGYSNQPQGPNFPIQQFSSAHINTKPIEATQSTQGPLSGTNITRQEGNIGSPSNSGASPRNTNGSRDVKTMEDDLRRMLKLNVLS